MMSMEQVTPTYGNEEIVAINSTIEVYYKRFKEIHARNKGIKNVAWGIFQKCKKSEDEYFFCSECYKKEPPPPLDSKKGFINKKKYVNINATLRNHLTKSHTHAHSRLLEI